MLDTADKARPQALNRTIKFNPLEPLYQMTKHDAEFEPGKVGAEAEVLADAESQMRIRMPSDIELERKIKDFLIAIRRWIEKAGGLSRRDSLPAYFGIGGSGPRELNSGRGPSQDLFDGGTEKIRLRSHKVELFGVFDQRQQAPAECVAGGFIAGNDKHQQI